MFGNYVTHLGITDGSKKKSKGKLESILNRMIMETEYIRIYGMSLKQHVRGNFVALNAYIGKEEWSQINDISVYFKN